MTAMEIRTTFPRWTRLERRQLDAESRMAIEGHQDEPRGLDPDDPLVPAWAQFVAARKRFLAGLQDVRTATTPVQRRHR